MAIDGLKEKGIPMGKHKDDAYYQFIMRKNNIVKGCRAVGCIDDDGEVHIYNHKKHKWES